MLFILSNKDQLIIYGRNVEKLKCDVLDQKKYFNGIVHKNMNYILTAKYELHPSLT